MLDSAKRARVKDLLSIEIRRLETELLTLKASEPVPQAAPTKPNPAASTVRFTSELSKYGWDQSEKYVKLFVDLPGVQAASTENVKLLIINQDVQLIVEDLNGKDHKLNIKNLLESVVAEKSYHKIKTDMIVVYMLKQTPGKNWDHLTKTGKKLSVASKADFSEGMMDSDPNAALMNMMKKMYETGDASTKQMIQKAYTENMNKSPEL